MLGQYATTTTATKILHGNFPNTIKVSKDTANFIIHLQMPDSVKKNGPNGSTGSLESVTSYWKIKREKANSSMSQYHIGTYKAFIYDLPLLLFINSVSNSDISISIPLAQWTNHLDVSSFKKTNKIRPSE
mmetsp:Transcript_664/g.694  ORF Transcript_664/g.694 Transcript_664/m.694 type:complete len:130 (+) Transcript_664:134-523(+)